MSGQERGTGGLIALCRRFLRGRYLRFAVLGPLAKLVEVFFDLLTPLVVARMVDLGANKGDLGAAVRYGLMLAAMALVGTLFTLICQKMASITSQGMGTDIRNALYERVNSLSSEELESVGDASALTRIGPDTVQVQVAVALAIRQLVRWPLLAVGSVVAALLIDIELGLVFLVSTPLIAAIFWFTMARCVPYFRKLQLQLDALARIVRENLSGVRVVRASGRTGHERERFGAAASEQAATAISSGRLSAILNPATLAVIDLSICVILRLGAGKVFSGTLSQGEVMAFVNYMIQTMLSIGYVANLVVVFTRASASAERICELLAIEPAIVDGPLGRDDADRAAPAVSCLELSYSFRGSGFEALQGVTFDLGAGESLGVIGGTGSGKTTLAELILRLRDASSGSLSVFGIPVRDWKLADLHALVSYVPQNPGLVSGTVRSNLLWRDPDATDDELWAALECAQAASFVRELEGGLDAPVEAGGRNFSGGQRQRLAIARALVADPAVLVLDDSSSALDYATEAALREAIAASRPGMARIVISQRVPTVMACDRILVLDGGRPVGCAPHGKLLEGCGLYRSICELQLAGEEVA